MSKSKNRKNHKAKSRARTQRISSEKAHFQKSFEQLMAKQIEEIKTKSSGDTEDTGLIQPTQEL
jgi:hypothetical protein